MTSELKPLDIWDDATNAVCQSMQENKMCNCPDGDCLAAKIEPPEETIRHWNTRAVPDVPELVRYSGKDICSDLYFCRNVQSSDDGEYVHYDQAAAMLAAKDEELKEAQTENIDMMWQRRRADERAEAAEAKLAQYEAQEPVGYVKIHPSGCFSNIYSVPIEGYLPLYAAPVDQTAEIERLREVISMTRNHISGEVFVGDKRLLDLVDTSLSGKEPL